MNAEGMEPVRMNGHVTIEEIEPGSPEWYFNRADAHCEVCDGRGRILNPRRTAVVPCPCTREDRS